MKKLFLSVVALLLVACMILPVFATNGETAPETEEDTTATVTAPVRTFYTPGGNTSNVYRTDGKVDVISEGFYEVISFDPHDVDGEWSDYVFNYGSVDTDVQRITIYLRIGNSIANRKDIYMSVEVVDKAGADRRDTVRLDFLPNIEGAPVVSMQTGTIDHSNSRAYNSTVFWKGDDGKNHEFNMNSSGSATSTVDENGIRTTMYEVGFCSSQYCEDAYASLKLAGTAAEWSNFTELKFRIVGTFENANGGTANVVFGSNDPEAKLESFNGDFPEVGYHILKIGQRTEFYAGEADKGFHSVDGIVSAGEYGVKMENNSPTGKYSYGRNIKLPISTTDSISNDFYFDYDKNYLYFASVERDSARDASVGASEGVARVMGTVSIPDADDPSNIGVFGINWKKTQNEFYIYGGTDANSESLDLSKYVRYRETVNVDGTVDKVFEGSVPRSLVEETAGAKIGDYVYLRFVAEMSNNLEENSERYVVGQTTSSEYTLPSDKWGADAANPFKVYLSGNSNATYIDVEDNGAVFYVGDAKASVKLDGIIDENDNYTVAIKDVANDPTREGYRYLNYTSFVSEDVTSYYFGIDDDNFYLAQTVVEADDYCNLFDVFVTAPDTDNVVFIRTWGKWGTSGFIKEMYKTNSDEESTSAKFAYNTHTFTAAAQADFFTHTTEAAISIADLKAVLGVEDISKLQFNIRCQLDGAAGGSDRTYHFISPKACYNGVEPEILRGGAGTAGYALFTLDLTATGETGTCEHTFTEITTLDSYNHGKYCTVCGTQTEVEAHSFDTFVKSSDAKHAVACECGLVNSLVDHDYEYAYGAVPGMATSTCTNCGQEKYDKYVPADGYLLKEYGQQWLFTGTAPSEEVGGVGITVDGVITTGEYINALKGNSNTNANQLTDYSVLHVNVGSEFFYFAYEIYDKSVLSENGKTRDHHNSNGWIEFYPATEGTLQSAITPIALAFNNYEGNYSDDNIGYGIQTRSSGKFFNHAVKAAEYTYTVLGQDNWGIDYGVGVYEFKVSIADVRAYLELDDSVVIDKLYIRGLQGAMNAASKGSNLASQIMMYYDLPADVKAVHGELANGYHAVFFGDITDHEDFLKAPEDGSRGTFYYGPCEEHNFGDVVPHNDGYEKQVCADCGYVEYVAHAYPDEWTVNEDRHSKVCGECGYVLEDAHDYEASVIEGNADAHKLTCTVCEYEATEAHSFKTVADGANGHKQICACGYETELAAHVTTVKYTAEGHYDECACGYATEAVGHTLTGANDETNHWTACECGYATEKIGHTLKKANDETNHWTACECGYKTAAEAHITKFEYNTDGHWEACDCGYKTDAVAHVYGEYTVTENDHSQACACGYVNTEAHTFGEKLADLGNGTHGKTCVCGAQAEVAAHVTTVKYTAEGHYDECACGYKTETIAHKFGEYTVTEDEHSRACDCGYVDEAAHNYVNNECECGKVAVDNGFVEIDGVTYYYVDGEKATGWQKIGSDWYYFAKADGAGLDGEKTVGGKVYTFEDGKAVTEALARTLFEYRIYTGPDYRVVGTEWFGDLYFENGAPIADGYQLVDGVWYLFENGAKVDTEIADGFYTDRNGYGYAEDGKAVADGLKTIDGATYYFAGGYAQNGEEVFETLFFFGEYTAFTGIKNSVYYLNGNIVDNANGIVEINGEKYYFVAGALCTGEEVTTQVIDGVKYLVGADGKLFSGVDELGYLYVDGLKAKEGLHKVNGEYYIADWRGKVKTAAKDEIDTYYAGESFCDLPNRPMNYTVDESGKLINGEYSGVLYINGRVAKEGIHKIGDDYYLVNWRGDVMKNCECYAWASNDSGLRAGINYHIGEDGKFLNGVVNYTYNEVNGDYLFINGRIAKEGLHKIGDDYYLVNYRGIVMKDCKCYAWASNDSGLQAGINYQIGEDGKLLNGIVEIDGISYAYVNGLTAYGIVEINGAYYYAEWDGHIIKDQIVYAAKGNGYTFAMHYTVDADGKIIG